MLVSLLGVLFLFPGFISVLGLAADPLSVSIAQLQKVLISLIEKAGKAKEGIYNEVLELLSPACVCKY